MCPFAPKVRVAKNTLVKYYAPIKLTELKEIYQQEVSKLRNKFF